MRRVVPLRHVLFEIKVGSGLDRRATLRGAQAQDPVADPQADIAVVVLLEEGAPVRVLVVIAGQGSVGVQVDQHGVLREGLKERCRALLPA